MYKRNPLNYNNALCNNDEDPDYHGSRKVESWELGWTRVNFFEATKASHMKQEKEDITVPTGVNPFFQKKKKTN